jgi:hypothetical protein
MAATESYSAFEIYRDPESAVEMQVLPQVSFNLPHHHISVNEYISDGTVQAITDLNRDNPDGYAVTTAAKEFKKAFCYDVNIHFVGVW